MKQIMAQNPIRKGLKVQIELETGSAIGSRNRIDCYILEPEFDRLTISFPESKSEFIPYLTEGSELKAFIYTFTGIIIIDSIVYDAPFEGKMVIEFNEEHQIIQRRKYLRMPYITDLYLETEEGNHRTDTIDIGGGGVRFVSEKCFKNEESIKAHLRLAQFEPMLKVEGLILKKNFYKPNEYVLEFMQIDESDRDKIIQKCIHLEREQNKKY